MKYQQCPIPILILILSTALAPLLAASGEDREDLRQHISGTLSVETGAGVLNGASPLNPLNTAALNETEAVLKGRFEWAVDWKDRVFLQVRPAFDWQFQGGSFADLEAGNPFTGTSIPSLWLDGLEVRWALDSPAAVPWLYSDIVFGRIYPESGIASIDPLAVLMDGQKGAYVEKPWLAGLLLYLGPVSLETWCETAETPQALVIARALLDKHECGALWAHDEAQRIGLWYRTSLGDSLMAGFEYQIREDDPFSPFKERDCPWNNSFLASLVWSPGSGNTGFWLEYRYREHGIESDAIGTLYSLGLPNALATLAVFPWLRSPVHSAGLHVRNTVAIANKWNVHGTLFWLGATGFHASAQIEYLAERRLSIQLEASAPIHIDITSSHSEAELWPYRFRVDLRGHWTVNTQE